MAEIISIFDLTVANIAKYGADGLVSAELDCCCMKGGLAPCGEGPYGSCVLAKILVAPDDPDADLIDPQTGDLVRHNCDPGDFVYVPMLVEWEKNHESDQCICFSR
jgi:hypothetical protein